MKNVAANIAFLVVALTTVMSCEGMATLFHGPKPSADYTLAFDANGADGNAPESQSAKSGEIITLPGKGNLNKAEAIFRDGVKTRAARGMCWVQTLNFRSQKPKSFTRNGLAKTYHNT
jgi:hypothetical protein